jgi:hypothetical protein
MKGNFHHYAFELFRCFETPALAEAHTWAAAIFVDEFDATQGQRAL